MTREHTLELSDTPDIFKDGKMVTEALMGSILSDNREAGKQCRCNSKKLRRKLAFVPSKLDRLFGSRKAQRNADQGL